MPRFASLCSSLSITALLLGASGCDNWTDPEVRVWLAGKTEPAIDDENLGCNLAGVADHQGVSIRHSLPEDVETDRPVEIRAETPCTAITTTMQHDVDGIAQTTLVAPAGAACSLSITVAIANDRHVCSSRDDDTDLGGAADPACARLDEVCAEVPDDDPERTDTSQ